MDRVEKHQQEQIRALLAHERQHRIEAANRELETLRLLERVNSGVDILQNNNPMVNIDEAYVTDRNESVAVNNENVKDIASFTSSTSNQAPSVSTADSQSKDIETQTENENNTQNKDEQLSDSVEESSQSLHVANSNLLATLRPTYLEQSKLPSASSINLERGDVSVLHYADTALSTELRRILNRSVLETAGMSVIGSTLGRGLDPLSSFARSPSVARLSKISDESSSLDKNMELEASHVSH